MTRVLVVTGTDTEVGKTVVTAALATLARDRGLRVAAVKPVQTGIDPNAPGDLDEVMRLSGITDVHEFARLPEPLAPATAARRAGIALPTVEKMAADVLGLSGPDLVLVEGAGGLLVEIDDRGGTIADLATCLRAPVLTVVRAGLGTLNAAALTCRAIRDAGLACLGVVIGSWPAEPDLAASCNLEDLPHYAGVPVRGRLPAGAGRLAPADFLRVAKAGLASELVDSLAADRMPPG